MDSAPEALGYVETSFLGFIYPGNDVTGIGKVVLGGSCRGVGVGGMLMAGTT